MNNKSKSQKDIIKSVSIIGIVSILMLILIVGAIQFLKDKIISEDIKQEEIAGKIEPTIDFESASTEIGKTVEEAQNETEKNEKKDTIVETEKVKEKNNTEKNKKSSKVEKNQATNTPKNVTEKQEEKKEEEKKEIKFQAPLKGEIIREFAADTLVYSETLKEWITHNGVDIKADKTTIVAAASDGIVEAINTDPRFGLTVIINHENGFKTVYSNLLTAEFVVKGENVKAGQTIGTVGNSASFEVADAYHLHFEILKNGEYQNPTVLIEF